MRGRDRIQYKTPDQVQLMRAAGLIVADALDAVREALAPGLTTADLDRIANRLIVGRGRRPVVPELRSPALPGDALCLGE